MKVVITEQFKEAYKTLFDELQRVIGSEDVSIQEGSLATYFAALQSAQKSGLNISNKFFRLPLEEPTFDVDMDSRTITVPTIFKNYGLGVQGDTRAEIVFFKVPRYYDVMDLNPNMDSVGSAWVVQWQNTNNKIVKSGNSPVVFTDAASEEVQKPDGTVETIEYVLLGWVITNEMTESSGNLEFALRFYTTEPSSDGSGNVVTYSIATQKAGCPIKGSLDLDIKDIVYDNDLENLIRNRPIYSGVINSMDGAAPTITLNLDNSHEYELSTDEENYSAYEVLEDSDGNPLYPDGIRTFTVEGESPDGGTVVYRWYRGREQLQDVLEKVVEEDPTYTAVTAGTYFAQIGNYKPETGTRWINSNTVTIPAAADLKYGDVTLFPTMMYSLGASPNEEQQGYKNSLTFDVTGYARPEHVKYTWTVDGQKVTEGVSGNTYVPPVDLEGTISCSAINYRNNTHSEPLVVSTPCTLRAWPDKPTAVNLEFVQTPGVIGGAITASVQFPPESPSSKEGRDKEWNIIWTREQDIDGATDSHQLAQKTLSISATFAVPTKQTYNTYTYRCKVNHEVFKNTALYKAGEPVQSKAIIIKVDKSGEITVTNEV